MYTSSAWKLSTAPNLRAGIAHKQAGFWTALFTAAAGGLSFLQSRRSEKAARRELGQARQTYGQIERVGRAEWENYRSLAYPLQREIVERAGDPSRRSELVAEAGLDVDRAFDAERDRLGVVLGRYGVDPTSGRFEGSHRELALGQAAAKAGAQTRARRDILEDEFGEKLDALQAVSAGGRTALAALGGAASGQHGVALSRSDLRGRRDHSLGRFLGDVAKTGGGILDDRRENA